MKQLTDKQKLIAGAVVLFIALVHFGPEYLRMFIPTGARAASVKPSPVRYAPVGPTGPPASQPQSTPVASSPEILAEGKYPGIWMGNEMMPDQYRCSIKLEIRPSDDLPKKIKGYESESCLPVQPLVGGIRNKASIADVIKNTAPISAVMTGTPSNNGVSFTVDQVIGATGPCVLTAFSITDFGDQQIIAQWQQGGNCGPGKMVLRKVKG